MKKIISILLVFSMLLSGFVITSQAAEVTYFDFWTDNPTYVTSAKSSGINAEQVMSERGLKIFEFEFKYPESVPSGEKNLTGIQFREEGKNASGGWNSSWSMPIGAITEREGDSGFVFEAGLSVNTATYKEDVQFGETYKVLFVMDLQEKGSSRLSAYVDGVLKRDKVSSKWNINNDTNKISQINIYGSTRGALYVPDSSYTIEGFSYEDWTARLESYDDVVTVDNEIMEINAGRATITVDELLEKLEIPEGATVKVLEYGEEVEDSTALTNDMKINVTLKFGNSISYDIVTGFAPLSSDDYSINVELDGNMVTEATVSGISHFTPAEEFLSSVSLGKDGAAIIGLDPQGEYVSKGMKLLIETVDGDTVPFELLLKDSYSEFENFADSWMIRNLHGKLQGSKTVISGSVDIPKEGLTKDKELYFELDVKKTYPIEFSTDGNIYIWGNNVGKYNKNASCDYVILTDFSKGCVSAYINGMKVLSDAAINSQFSTEDDPYELVGGEYNPSEYGEFLLAEIHSAEAFEVSYAQEIAMLESEDKAVEISYDVTEGAIVNLFVNDGYTLSSLDSMLNSSGGSKKYFGADGNEITSEDAPINSISKIEVTSQSGNHTNVYTVFFPEEVLASTEFEIDDDKKTVGKLLYYSPANVLLDTLTVVRPDYTLKGIYRGNTKIGNADVIMENDVLRLSNNGADCDYTIEFIDDFTREGSTMYFTDVKNSVIAMEGTFKIPEEGLQADVYSVWFSAANTANIRSVFEFFTDLRFKMWKNEFQLEKGKTYIYSYVHDHKTGRYDFYLNGVKVVADGTTTHSLTAGSDFDSFILRGPLAEEDGLEKMYRVYSRESYVYKYDLSIEVASPNTVTKGAKNIINVKDASCSTVEKLLNIVTYKNAYADENAEVYGNGELIENTNTKLRNGMILKVKADNGFTTNYYINVEHSPITSWVFDVEGNKISYDKGNLTYYDFASYCLLADGCDLVVKTSSGEVVSSGYITTGMKAYVGGKTYTISLGKESAVPSVKIVGAENGEILKTTDTYTKIVKVSGEGVKGVSVYLDGVKYVLGNAAGDYTFTKSNLTSGRHEIYAVAETDNVNAETEHYSIYAFEKETDRLRAAQQPAVLEISYLDEDGEVIQGDKIDYGRLYSVVLTFNKPLKEESVNSENFALYGADMKLGSSVKYSENIDSALYTVAISDFGTLQSSAEYEIRIGGNVSDADGNKAKDESKVIFKTTSDAFGIVSDSLINASGNPVENPAGGDSIKAKIQLTNTSAKDKSGVVILTAFDGDRMVGYSITPFTIEEGIVSKTFITDAAEIEESASENLKVYRYVWNDINGMSTIINQVVLK